LCNRVSALVNHAVESTSPILSSNTDYEDFLECVSY